MSLKPKRIPGIDRDLEDSLCYLAAAARLFDGETGQSLVRVAEELERLSHAPNRPEDLDAAREKFRKACQGVIELSGLIRVYCQVAGARAASGLGRIKVDAGNPTRTGRSILFLDGADELRTPLQDWLEMKGHRPEARRLHRRK